MSEMRVISVAMMSLLIVSGFVTSKNIPTFQNYGEVIALPERYNLRELETANIKPIKERKGKLIVSNSPERIKQTGILYKEAVEGKGRLVLHHINQVMQTEGVKLVVRVGNPTNQKTTCYLRQMTIKGPCEDILYTGQKLLYDYLGDEHEEKIVLKPYEKQVLYTSEKDRWQYEQVISGMIDFETNGTVEWEVLAIDKETSNEIDIMDLKCLEKDQHPRGTYGTLEKAYKVKIQGDRAEQFVIGEVGSEWEVGKDALTEEIVENRGDFGVLYKVAITAKKDITLLVNPRGDLFKGAIKIGEQPVILVPHKGELSGGNRVIIGGIIEEGATEELIYMLPNGSSAPVLFALVPHNGKNVEILNKL